MAQVFKREVGGCGEEEDVAKEVAEDEEEEAGEDQKAESYSPFTSATHQQMRRTPEQSFP